MTEVTLNQILNARDERAKKQKSIFSRFKYPLISFTLNIAGPIKTSPLIERAFYEGIRILKDNIKGKTILYEDIAIKDTGCEAIFSVKDNAVKLKDICIDIEDSLSLGRLFDMDVIDTDGNKLERKDARNCIVCGAPGRACAAGRLHSVNELQSVTRKIIENYFFLQDRNYCASLAVKSLSDEVHTTPKPGLVDCRNNGSHNDMDINLFIKSANALKPYFEDCFSIGKKTSHLSNNEAFTLLRNAGIKAEQTMYNATGGVNTHKGVIYSMGILCASIGRLWEPESPFADVSDVCLESSKFAKNTLTKDFEQIGSTSAGGRLYIEYGLTGIRGEVASGFNSVLKFGLPCYECLRTKYYNQNDAGAITLLHFIANVEDTNIYHRGGINGAEHAKQVTTNLLKEYPEPTSKQIESLDDDFIKHNLSPGGCADLLAITYFLHSLKS